MTEAWARGTACPNWQKLLLAGKAPVPELVLDREEADRALRVFRRLHVPDILGSPTLGDLSPSWFEVIIEALFGSYDKVTHRRGINEVFVLVPKKNGKSSNAGALAITTMIVNRRPAAEFLFIAPTKQIADIAFRQASLTIKADPDLATLFHVQHHIRRITHRVTDAIAQIKAADTDAITGGKNTYALIDETHEFAKKPRAAEVFVEIRGALASRPDGFLIQLTTQSKEPPVGVFKAELAIARAVRDEIKSSTLLPILYELPHELTAQNGWKNRKYWPIVNPNLGKSVDLEFLERELVKAEHTGAEQLALFASQHFNVQIGLSLKSDRWAGADHWLGAALPGGLTLEHLIERCDTITIGIDGGGLDDLLSVAVLGRERDTRRWLVWGKSFANLSALRKRKSDATAMVDFAAAGELVVVDAFGPIEPSALLGRIYSDAEDVLDPDAPIRFPPDIAGVVEFARQIDASGKLAFVGVDPAGLGMIIEGLASVGITESEDGPSRIVGVSQGYPLMGAIKTAERKLADGTLRHAGHALMAWAVGNAKVESKSNYVIITKQAAGGAGKIDPIMAMFDAIALMNKNPEADGPSVYNDPTIRPDGFLCV